MGERGLGGAWTLGFGAKVSRMLFEIVAAPLGYLASVARTIFVSQEVNSTYNPLSVRVYKS